MGDRHFRKKIAAIADSCPICDAEGLPLTRTKKGGLSFFCEVCRTRAFLNTADGVQYLRNKVGLSAYQPTWDERLADAVDDMWDDEKY